MNQDVSMWRIEDNKGYVMRSFTTKNEIDAETNVVDVLSAVKYVCAYI